jgi:arylsulfatase
VLRCPRRALLLALAAALASCGRALEPRASFLLITCDTLRADHLGFLGHSRPTSPNLDALAAESVVFEHAWSTAPLTGPALSALLTGRPPEELGLGDNRVWLGEAAETLAERARAAGIETAAVVSNWVLRKRERGGVQQGFEHFDDDMRTLEPSRPDLKERLAADTTDAALAWLAGRDPERPFFLWVHYQDPHGPYTPPADCLAPFAPEPRGEPALGVGQDQKVHGALPPYQVVDGERRPEVYRQRYEAEIRAFDRELGRLLYELRARGLLATTTLAFTADHGESLGENGWWFSHGQTLQRELVHVPLLLRPPGGAASARHVSAPVSHLDLLPTALAALGLPAGELRGLDLLAAPPPAERVLPQFLRGSWSAVGATHRLLMTNGTPALFELDDVREERDLAAARPELVQALVRAQRDFLRSHRLPPLEPERAPANADEERGLDALGYGGEDEDHED